MPYPHFSLGASMIVRILGSLLVCASLALAKSATAPSTKPVIPSTQPTTFASPSDLIKQWKQSQKETDALPKVAYIDISGPVSEKPPAFSFLVTANEPVPLRSILDRLHRARDDK